MSKKKPAKKPAFILKRPKFNDPLQIAVASLYEMAKGRAKRKRVPFELAISDIPHLASSRLCPITGLPYVLGVVRDGNRPHPMSPSLDRVKAASGYVRGNVRLVSWWANSARNNLSDEQFAVMIEATHRTLQSAALQ